VIKNEKGDYEPSSIQLSDQAELLINQQVIKPSKKDPIKFHVTRNNTNWDYPPLEFGAEALAVPQHNYIDRELFFLLTTFQEVTIATNIKPTFISQMFPSTYAREKKNLATGKML